jgi:hypothetical protein
MGRVRSRTACLLIVPVIFCSTLRPRALLNAQQSAIVPAKGAQDAPTNADTSVSSHEHQTEEILRMLGGMRQELKDSRQEVDDLRKEVNELREELAASTHSSADAEALKTAVDQLQDDQQVVQSQVKTLDQAKVGTESRYSLRLTGMVLFNSFVVDGAVDDPSLPLIALPRNNQYVHHSLGASLDQTQLGFNATGPKLWNARTSADLTADFFTATNYALTAPSYTADFRLRTAGIDLDWKNTQVSGGLQTPLITPLSPTSFATVGQPALSWAGNLWTWLPQASVERREALSGSSHALLAFGLIDPEAAKLPTEQAYGILRQNLQPGYEGRIAYEWGDERRPYEIGANGYYARQLYYGAPPLMNQALDFWAGTADWRVPVAPIAELSGEFYRGRGIGDLGGGAFKNVVMENGAEYARGLDAAGGWAQLKSRLTPTIELNGFFGEDSAYAGEVRDQATVANPSPYLYLVRNQSAAANIIFRPKKYLIFAGEYRYLHSWYIYGPAQEAQTLDLTMGYLF